MSYEYPEDVEKQKYYESSQVSIFSIWFELALREVITIKYEYNAANKILPPVTESS